VLSLIVTSRTSKSFGQPKQMNVGTPVHPDIFLPVRIKQPTLPDRCPCLWARERPGSRRWRRWRL